MEINSPIVFVTLDGDVKKKVSTCAYTLLASYEVLKQETAVMVKADLISKKEQGQLEKTVKQHYQKYGKVKSVKYYKDGADVIQMITNN
jgi:chlorite dismutase